MTFDLAAVASGEPVRRRGGKRPRRRIPAQSSPRTPEAESPEAVKRPGTGSRRRPTPPVRAGGRVPISRLAEYVGLVRAMAEADDRAFGGPSGRGEPVAGPDDGAPQAAARLRRRAGAAAMACRPDHAVPGDAPARLRPGRHPAVAVHPTPRPPAELGKRSFVSMANDGPVTICSRFLSSRLYEGGSTNAHITPHPDTAGQPGQLFPIPNSRVRLCPPQARPCRTDSRVSGLLPFRTPVSACAPVAGDRQRAFPSPARPPVPPSGAARIGRIRVCPRTPSVSGTPYRGLLSQRVGRFACVWDSTRRRTCCPGVQDAM